MRDSDVMLGHISPNLTSVSDRKEQLNSLTSRSLEQLFPMWSNIRSIWGKTKRVSKDIDLAILVGDDCEFLPGQTLSRIT